MIFLLGINGQCLLLKNATKEISPFLTDIFEHSIWTGKLPDEWVEANEAPVFKKGDRHTASNYRTISLTCVRAKLLEHIICKNIMTHFTKNEILTSVQHGFHAEHSCETNYYWPLKIWFKITRTKFKLI